MALIDGMLQELEQEAQTTRRVLERVPDDRLAWKPHAKSRMLGQLALHIATVPGAVAALATSPSPAQAPQFADDPSPATAAELIPALDASIARARQLVGRMDDATLMEIWTMKRGDRELFSVPRGALLRSVMLNHWYHHRGQLTVYLRLLDAPVPAVYGPSADDPRFL